MVHLVLSASELGGSLCDCPQDTSLGDQMQGPWHPDSQSYPFTHLTSQENWFLIRGWKPLSSCFSQIFSPPGILYTLTAFVPWGDQHSWLARKGRWRVKRNIRDKKNKGSQLDKVSGTLESIHVSSCSHYCCGWLGGAGQWGAPVSDRNWNEASPPHWPQGLPSSPCCSRSASQFPTHVTTFPSKTIWINLCMKFGGMPNV